MTTVLVSVFGFFAMFSLISTFDLLLLALDLSAILFTLAYLWHLVTVGREIRINVFEKRSLLNQHVARRIC